MVVVSVVISTHYHNSQQNLPVGRAGRSTKGRHAPLHECDEEGTTCTMYQNAASAGASTNKKQEHGQKQEPVPNLTNAHAVNSREMVGR